MTKQEHANAVSARYIISDCKNLSFILLSSERDSSEELGMREQVLCDYYYPDFWVKPIIILHDNK